MQTFRSSLFAILMLTSFIMKAQSPQQLNYQAVVRNAQGQPVTTGTVSMRFTIHSDSANGASVFQEVHHASPNQFGLVNLGVGSLSGNLATVNWGSGSKFLQVELDAAGGTNYSDMGTTQLLSVPYALYAANSAPGPVGPTGVAGLPGITGTNGANGATGSPGVTGPTGAGPTGATGPSGNNGATGATGANGITGPSGQDGSAGLPGLNGAIGQTGATGPSGVDGTNGQPGTNGATGATGAPGTNGTNGTNGVTGATGPSGSDAALPSGAIIMWSGTLATIPAGWVLCDGTNGTPNLLDRFVISVPNNATNPGATGGSNSVTLSVAQLPSHTHTGSGSTSTDGAHTHSLVGYNLTSPGSQIPFYNWANSTYANNNTSTGSAGAHNHTFSFTSDATGSGAAIDIHPAYYTLAFIMKQ